MSEILFPGLFYSSGILHAFRFLNKLSLIKVFSREHNSENKTVICPICIVNPAGDPNQMVRDLAQHMTVEHQASGPNHFLCGGEGKSNWPIRGHKTQAPRSLTLSHSQKGGAWRKRKKNSELKKKYFC